MRTRTSTTAQNIATAVRAAIASGADVGEILTAAQAAAHAEVSVPDPQGRVFAFSVEGAASAHAYRGTTVSCESTERGIVVEASVVAVDTPDDGGDQFVWNAASGTVTRNGVVVPAVGTGNGGGATGRVVVAVPLDFAEEPTDLAELISGVGGGTTPRGLPVPSASYALCLVAAGEVDAAVVDVPSTAWEVPQGQSGERTGLEAAIAIIRAVGGEVTTDGSIVVAGRHRVDARIAHLLLELSRRREYRASPPPLEETEALRPTSLMRGRRVRNVGRLARAQGCLLGQASGDALGQLVEFSDPAIITRRYPEGGPHELVDGGAWHTIAGQPTDDTEMALCLARTIVHAGGYDREAVARAYMRWGTGDLPTTLPGEHDRVRGTRPYDIGGTTSKALHAPTAADVEAGTVADACTRASIGSIPANGALMRVSPLGIWGAGKSPELVALAACTDAALTHGHPFTVAASAAYAVAIGHAIWTGAGPRETWQAALDIARGPHGDPEVAEVIVAAAERPPADYMHHMGACATALQNAFFRLLHAPTLEDGVVATVRAGGDTDTTAAIAGALMGAVYGRDAIPAQWRRMVVTCRPLARADGSVHHPRPRCLWPVDVMALAERLLLTWAQ